MAGVGEVYDDYLSVEFVAMAHRGGALYAPNLGIENTLKAFGNAVDLGYTYLETDVHATKDGHLIVFHDDTLARMSDLDMRVMDLTLAEVREIQLAGREPIPTLDELLELFPVSRFNIDLKHAGAIGPLAQAIKAHGAERRVCVGSFSRQRIRKFRSLMPRVPTAVSVPGVVGMTMGVLPPSGDVFQVPLTHSIGPATVDIVTPRNIARIHASGRKIHVWTIDDATTMHRLIDWGVDGIVSDRPDLLKAVLMARGMWSTQ